MANAGDGRALDAAKQWAQDIGRDAGFARLITETTGRTYLAGQLMVRAVELADEGGAAGTVSLTRSVHTRDDSASFLSLPYEEALRFFREKDVISAEEFDALEDRFKTGGFVARQLASQRLEQVAHDSIAALLAQDITIPEVVQRIRDGEGPEIAALGISPASDAYLENVIRTNVASAYGAGRWSAMNDPNVVALRGFMQCWTAGDSRVRKTHAALHGRVFRLGTEEASYSSSPRGFNCRCSATTLSQRQIEARGLVVETGRVAGSEPDEGWGGAPALLSEGDA